MSVYVLADPHLSLGSEKPMDIFRGWSDYVERIKSRWTSLVAPGDTVVLPGDISWAMSLPEATEDFRFLNSLPGTKIIGKGNHDYWWNTMNKMNMFLAENKFDTIRFLYNNAYSADGISVCGTRGWFFDAEKEDIEKILRREAGRLRTSIEAGLALGTQPVVFLHYPAYADSKVCTPIMDVLREYDIKRCYFGHIHGDTTGKYADYEYDGVRFSLVSADFLAFCPKLVII